ncbi:hypothetical protein AQJ58_39585 [Streptomyces sp. DSM 15324]|nr:hypothetical protein AQJ58_39585 [Streptomyces sp. DSM 15324]
MVSLNSSAPRTAQGPGRSFRLGLAQRDLAQVLGRSLVGVAVLTLTGRRRGVVLTEDALVVVDGARRELPWSGIARLEVRRVLGVSQVVAHLADGRRTTLPAPTSFVDARFEAKVRELTQWWAERRLSPPPAAAAPTAPAP